MSVFGTNIPVPLRDVAAEDSLKKMRDEEQARAERDRTKAIQAQLSSETVSNSGEFGIRSLLGPFGSGRPLNSLLGSGTLLGGGTG